MMATPAFDKLRAERGLFPFDKTGPELDAYVKQRVAYYRTLAATSASTYAASRPVHERAGHDPAGQPRRRSHE